MRAIRTLLPVLLAALVAGCATSQPSRRTDPELARVASAARVTFDQGSPAKAARLYARSLRMARATDDAHEIGNNAYNLAACMAELAQYDDAMAMLGEARGEFARAGRSAEDLLMLEAKIERRRGRLDEAVALAARAVDAAKGAAAVRVQAAVLRADVACDRGDPAGAQKELEGVAKNLGALGDPVLAAQAAGVAGRALAAQNEPGRTGAEYDREANLYRKAGKYRDMALALGRAGEAYSVAQQPAVAGDRFYRGARSLYAQGNQVEALKMIQTALESAEKSGDTGAVARMAGLFEEIRRSVKTPGE